MGLERVKVQLVKELWELLSQKILINYIFFGIVFLDALGAVLPTYLDRKVTIFVAFPLILVIYILNTKKKNLLFLLALVFNFLGICNFNNPYEEYNSDGLIYHVFAFILYSIILFRRFKRVSVALVLKLAVVLILIVCIPVVIYSEGMMQMFIFREIMLYVISASLFVFSSLLVYGSNKTKINKLLLASAVFVFLSSCFQGSNLFVSTNYLLNFFAIIFFNLTHYSMCLYLIKSSYKKF